MREADFQRQVCDLADLCGWSWWHSPDSRRIRPGWPDLILLRQRGDTAELVVVELKTERGKVSTRQAEVISTLQMAGVEAHVWRPSDWPTIRVRLQRLSPSVADAAADPATASPSGGPVVGASSPGRSIGRLGGDAPRSIPTGKGRR